MVEKELMSVKTLCERYDLKEDCVRKWLRLQLIPYYKLGHLVRIPTKQFENWMQTKYVCESSKSLISNY